MRTEHLTTDELEAYARRRLAPADALEISDHLLGCELCREHAAAAVRTAADEVPDVTYEELAAWMDDELEPIERREVQLKLGQSPRARAELDDLLRFKAEADRLSSAEQQATLSEGAPTNVVPFFSARWALPLAAALALSGGALWWSAQTRSDRQGYVRLRDNGRELRITSHSDSGAFQQLPKELRAAVRAAAVAGQVQVPEEIAALAGRRGTLAGAPSAEPLSFRVLSPIATAVRDGKPQFSWTPLANATAYRIRVMSLSSGELVASEMIAPSSPTWTPATPFRDGETYEWEVEALNGEQVIAKSPEPPQPEARFAVISAAKGAEFARLREAARGSHLSLGVAAARAGLLDEAASEFTALGRENPHSPTPQRLLAEVQERRRPK